MFRVVAITAALLLLTASPTLAADDDVQPSFTFLPGVHFGTPGGLSVAGTYEAYKLPKGHVLVGVDLGVNASSFSVGWGALGGKFADGHALKLSMLRSYRKPDGIAPKQTFIGVEAEAMLFMLSVKGGPFVRVAGDPSDDNWFFGASIGFGF